MMKKFQFKSIRLKIMVIILIGINLNIPSIKSFEFFDTDISEEDILIDSVYMITPKEPKINDTLYLEKGYLYEIYLELYIPDCEMNITFSVVGPDGDIDGFKDEFIFADGALNNKPSLYDNQKKHKMNFVPARSGNYSITIDCELEQIINLHFYVYDKGTYMRNSLLSEVDGYYTSKRKEYYVNLEDDTEYYIAIERTNEIPYYDYYYCNVSVSIYDDEMNKLLLIKNHNITDSFDPLLTNFGTHKTGHYIVEVYFRSTIPTSNIYIELFREDQIGNGPENPLPREEQEGEQEDFNISEIIPEQIFILVPEIVSNLFIYILLAIFAVVIIIIFIKKKDKTPKIVDKEEDEEE